MSTKDQPGPFDGLERAEPGEPVFTLRAHDKLAAPLVREWCYQRRTAIITADLPADKERLELVQVREAEVIAEAMEEWHSRDRPAPEVVAPVHYSGVVETAAELATKNRADAVRVVVTRLHNSTAELADAAEALAAIAADTPADPLWPSIGRLRELSDAAKNEAGELTPKRSGR